jgi:hypothetical protein
VISADHNIQTTNYISNFFPLFFVMTAPTGFMSDGEVTRLSNVSILTSLNNVTKLMEFRFLEDIIYLFSFTTISKPPSMGFPRVSLAGI